VEGALTALVARARDDVRRAVDEAVERDALDPSELRALAQALRDLASDLCERAGRVE